MISRDRRTLSLDNSRKVTVTRKKRLSPFIIRGFFMNRKMILGLSLALLVFFTACSKQQKEKPENDFRVGPLDGGKSLEITGYAGKTQVVNIPSKLYKIPVTGIGKTAFQKKEIIKVTIPGSVTAIGDRAFAENLLTVVTIGGGVKTIGEEAFIGNQLTKVTIGGGVTAIGERAFQDNQIANITIPKGVTDIDAGAFFNNKITGVTIPDSVTTIGAEAFAGNPLTGLSLSQGNTSFITKNSYLLSKDESQVILYYGAEKDATIPDGVTVIGPGAFSNNQLTGVTIPDSVTIIEFKAFRQNQLTGIIIPEGVTTIGDLAFAGNQITSITIGANVNIGRSSLDDSGYFNYTYANYGRRAGTYIMRNGYWSRQ
jgi:hypothetical protein